MSDFNLSTHERIYLTTKENAVDLNDLDFKVAVSFEGFRDKKFKIDTRYVKWIIRMVGENEGVSYEKIIPFHKCTNDDLD